MKGINIRFILRNSLFLVISLSIFSCVVYGLTNDYGKLSNEQKKRIHIFEESKPLVNNEVYKINGLQLKNELKKNEKSLVVEFANGCSSKYCVPLSNYTLYAKQNGYSLYLVMVGYADLNVTLKQNVDAPLFSIDNDYYNSRFKYKYVDKFENDFIENKPEDFCSIFIFKRDSLVDTKRNFAELNKGLKDN